MFNYKENKRVKSKETKLVFPEFNLSIHEMHIPGHDDPVYEKNKDIWENIPRGLAYIYDSEKNLISSLAGTRKFGYPDSRYGYKDKVITTIGIEKENGECAHVATFIYNETKFWIVGSKHVNVVFREGYFERDILQYKENQRYTYALKIAYLFINTMSKITEEQKDKFFDILYENKMTANGEAIFDDSQHIIDYEGINQIRWFALSKNTQSKEGLSEHPFIARDFFISCGLFFADCSQQYSYKSQEYVNYLDNVAKRLSSEGVVMYGLDNGGKVICMWKEKSYPYVMERVLREAIKRGMVGNELYIYSQKRLSQQSDELRKYFESWEKERLPFLIKFAAWLHTQDKKKVNFDDPWSISSKWLSLQKECIKLSDDELLMIADKYKNKKLSGVSSIQTIVLAGPPGSGKSTLARTLMILLKKCGKIPVWLNQDEAGDRKRYLTAIDKAISSNKVTHIILDKSNLEKCNRKDYTDRGLDPMITVVLTHSEGNEALIDMCVKRILNRGDAHRSLRTSNPNFKDDPKKAITTIIEKFVEKSDIDESADSTYQFVDASLSQDIILSQVWERITHIGTGVDYPIFNTIGNQIKDSLVLAQKYEEKLASRSKTQQLYACLKLVSPVEELLDVIPDVLLKNKILKKEFHVTVKYFGGVIDPEMFIQIDELINKQIELTLKEVVYDENGVAVLVKKDFFCDNTHPHFTIATARNIPPVYSNELLQKTENVTRIQIDKKVICEYAFM